MMWAPPIANNIIQLLVLGLYLGIWGTSDGASPPFTGPPQAGLLGGGATFGIIVQSAVMVIWLRKIGYRYRPRFDLKGQGGLGHTFHLAKWTLASSRSTSWCWSWSTGWRPRRPRAGRGPVSRSTTTPT